MQMFNSVKSKNSKLKNPEEGSHHRVQILQRGATPLLYSFLALFVTL